MKMILFAGGAGTRLWPLSRKAIPKQFAPFFEGRSTLQLAVDRVAPFGIQNLYISTREDYAPLVQAQVPALPNDHLLCEPTRRDLAAAVCLALLRLKQRGVHGTVAILWSDHLMQHPDRFASALQTAEELLEHDRERLIFLGERPRFANHNLGWIHTGARRDDGSHAFLGWKYRPELSECVRMHESGEWLWNPGYFVFDADVVLGLYAVHQPAMLHALQEAVTHPERLPEIYASCEVMHFDQAILEKISPSQAVVLPVSMGWSDPGTLYAMKEALAPSTEANVHVGNVIDHGSRDGFVYNECDDQTVVTVGLDGVIVVNTPDAVLVCHKDAVPDIKPVLARLEAEGLDHLL